MCTLACWIGVFPEAPLVVAANRDEKRDRPSLPPLVWPGTPRVIAPKDEISGGTWWAVNEHGLFVGLTNRAGAPPDPQRRSRGLVVLDLARCRSVDEAHQLLKTVRPGDYNGFHVVVTDGHDTARAIDTGSMMRVHRLPPGFHILTERSFEATVLSRDDRVLDVFGRMSERPLDVLAIQRGLATHDESPWTSICVHAEELNYGTRSSTVLVLGPGRRELYFAPEAPCRSRFEDVSSLLAFPGPR